MTAVRFAVTPLETRGSGAAWTAPALARWRDYHRAERIISLGTGESPDALGSRLRSCWYFQPMRAAPRFAGELGAQILATAAQFGQAPRDAASLPVCRLQLRHQLVL